MADDIGYTPGAGATIAADEVVGVLFQRIKLTLGADGVNDGDVSAANPVPVSGALSVSNFPAQTGLTDAQLRASAVPVSGTFFQATQPVSAASLPLPTGAATSALQPDVLTTHPVYGDRGSVVRQAPADIWSVGFADSGSSLLASEFTQRRLGTGHGVTQSSSNLLVTTGTTANSEFLARSTTAFRGAFTARHKTILSQRIAQNNFAVMMADLIGEGLACTINSATSITVTKVAHGFTAVNVGQFMMVGAISGAAGVPNRYAIASIPSVDTINFTVAGWPASGSCTVDLFGWNYLWTQYSGTTATNASIDAQRRGWNSGLTTATINTTASPGHVMQTYADGRNVAWSDALVASATTPTVTTRGSRVESLPDDDVSLYLYLWSYNGTSAPASTTTWTLGFISVEDNANVPTYIAGVRPTGNAAPLPVSFTQPALVAGSALVGDVAIQYRGSATGAGTLTNVNSPATPVAQQLKSGAGRLLSVLVTNTSASTRWLKIFNLASASVTPGTTSATTEIGIAGGRTLAWSLEGGAAFSTGITIMITGGQGLTNNTAITLGDVTGFTSHA